MKANFVLAAIVGIVSFSIFRWQYLRCSAVLCRAVLVIIGLAAAVPTVLFASNYVLYVPYAKWFCEMHAAPGMEAASGLVAGILGIMYASAKLRPSRLNAPVLAVCTVLALGLLVTPFVKQMLWSADYAGLQDKWQDGICLQTSSHTCVPACTATVVRILGGNLTESQIAREAGTTKTGTEVWYLMRALRRRGYEPEFRHVYTTQDAPVPSILGVHIGDIGHVVVLLSKNKHGVIVGEPLKGRRHYSWSVFKNHYKPDGTCITIRKIGRGSGSAHSAS